jgi:hypothetical protein
MPSARFFVLALVGLCWVAAAPILPAWADQAGPVPAALTQEFPKTDFSTHAVPLDEIMSGGPRRDGIPSIDDPTFRPVSQVRAVKDEEPVVVVTGETEARAYPLQILMWHEIVNDTLDGQPIAVTYCPLCGNGIVFDRRVDGMALSFGTTGRLRKSNLVMYDRQTESWWQQLTGEAIIGALTGETLDMVPAALMSMQAFRAAHPQGMVLLPPDPGARQYGANPYVGYDSSRRPFLFKGDLPEGIAPLARVVVVDGTAYALSMIREHGTLDIDGLRFSHTPGMASALDAPRIEWGRDVGAVSVMTANAEGEPVPHYLAFAFAFHAFHPDARIVTAPESSPAQQPSGASDPLPAAER